MSDQKSFSSLRIAALLGDLSFDARPRRPLKGDGDSFIPAFDGGTTELKVDDLLAGLAYVELSGDVGTEDLLMRDAPTTGYARYDDQAPRTPTSGADDIETASASSGFTSRSNFQSGARSALGLSGSDGATYARARIRRFEVTSPSALASSLSERTPVSRKITKLLGQDGQGNPLTGWVYVETAVTVGQSIAERQIHQLVPAGMLLAPGGGTTLVAYDNSQTNWDLAGLIGAQAQSGMQYTRCVVWASLVYSVQDMQNAGLPGAPAVPDGVEGWSG